MRFLNERPTLIVWFGLKQPSRISDFPPSAFQRSL